MPGIDASIYSQVKQPDPLGTLGEVLDVQGKMYANKLAQMGVQGKQILGEAVQAATGPDGTVDTVKLNNILKQPGNYAAAVEGAGLGLDLQQKQIANQSATMGQGEQANVNLSNVWGARLQANPKSTAKEFREDVLDMIISGRIPKEYGKQLMNDIPDDDKAARQFVATHFISALGPAGSSSAMEAAPQAPGFEPRKQTTGQFTAGALGVDDAGAGGGAPPQSPAPAGAPPPPGTVPAEGPQAAAPIPAAPGVVTGASPIDLAAAQAAGTNASNQATSLANVAVEVPNRKAMLHNMLDDAAQFTSGPVSAELNQLNAGVNEVFGTKFNLEGVAAQERFDKLANQIALAQASAGGFNATDLTKNMTSAANPHSGLSQTGVKSIIGMLLGNEDAIAVKWHEFEKTGLPYSKFTQWSGQFNKNFDPRIFQSVYMSPTELKTMLGTMKGTDRHLFQQKYNYAVAQGWIPDPRGGQ